MVAKLILIFACLIASSFIAHQAEAQEAPTVICTFAPTQLEGVYLRPIKSDCVESPMEWEPHVWLQRDDDETTQIKIYIDPNHHTLETEIQADLVARLIIDGNLDGNAWHQVLQ